MTSKVTYKGKLRTSCTHLQSDSTIETDAPIDNNGKGERFSPTDLLATSLASCMLTVMGIKANSMNIDMEGIEVDVEKGMEADPRRVAKIGLSFRFPTGMNMSDKEISILKHTALTCPVAKSIHPDIVLNIDWGRWN